MKSSLEIAEHKHAQIDLGLGVFLLGWGYILMFSLTFTYIHIRAPAHEFLQQ